MKRSFSLLMIAAAVLAGCNPAERVSSPASGFIQPGRPTTQSLQGTVTANQTQRSLGRFALQLNDGTTIGLMGSEADPLASVIGAEVEVITTTPADLSGADVAVEVQSFRVLSVEGTQVNDGVLEFSDGVYSLHVTGGRRLEIPDPPRELTDYVGQRIWLALGDGTSELKFGVIQA